MRAIASRIARLESHHAGGLMVCLLPIHLTAEEKAARLQVARAEAGPGDEVLEIVGVDPDGLPSSGGGNHTPGRT